MTLSVILSRNTRDPVTAPPDITLRDTARLLTDNGIGAVLVTNPDRTLVGIISERDIVRAIARSGPLALDESVTAHMTTRVVTASASTGVNEAMEWMTAGRFRHIPVMRGGRVEGVVSIGDLVKHRLSEMEHENKALHEYITA